MESAHEIIEQIEYKRGYLLAIREDDVGAYLQVQCYRPDTYTREMGWGHGGKSYFDPDTVTTDQLVQMAFGLFRAYEEHECREAFKFNGLRIYGPHMTLEALVMAAQKSVT